MKSFPRAILAVLVLFLTSCEGAAPLAESFPEKIGGMTRTEFLTGPEALKRINMLHGKDIEAEDGAVAVYRDGPQSSVVFVTRSASPEIAKAQTEAMLKGMFENPKGHFSDPVAAEMDGLRVVRFKGLSQAHFIFQVDDASWWLSTDPASSGEMLSFFIGQAKKR